MCDENGLCTHGEAAKQRMHQVHDAIERVASGDGGGMAAFVELLGESPFDGFVALCGLASIGHTYFLRSAGAPEGSKANFTLMAAIDGATGKTIAEEDMPRGLKFTGAFMVAYANADMDECMRLYTETMDDSDDTYFADCVKEMVDTAIGFMKKLLAMGKPSWSYSGS